MRTHARQSESVSRTMNSQPKASRQAPVQAILQRYADRTAQAKEEPLRGKPETAQRQEWEDDELLQGKFGTVQRQEWEEDEPLQGKFDTVQRMELDEEEPIQGKFETVQRRAWGGNAPVQAQAAVQRKAENRTGLPDRLKAGAENLSGYSLNDVRVHYNSSKPAQLQALAYTQGTDIHVGPGQERHLPHETWHVVQQMQGRVRPTLQMRGVNVNDNSGLEKEADIMGSGAMNASPLHTNKHIGHSPRTGSTVAQLATKCNLTTQTIKHVGTDANGNPINNNLTVGKKMKVTLDPSDPSFGTPPNHTSKEHNFLMNDLKTRYDNCKFIRGHLWNDHLGGPGIWENMFPISSEANKAHLESVERPVKRQLLKACEYHHSRASSLDGKIFVDYTVEAKDQSRGDFLANPSAIFDCEWNTYYETKPNDSLPTDIWKGSMNEAKGDAIIRSNAEQKSGQNEMLVWYGWGAMGQGKDTKKETGLRDEFKKITIKNYIIAENNITQKDLNESKVKEKYEEINNNSRRSEIEKISNILKNLDKLKGKSQLSQLQIVETEKLLDDIIYIMKEKERELKQRKTDLTEIVTTDIEKTEKLIRKSEIFSEWINAKCEKRNKRKSVKATQKYTDLGLDWDEIHKMELTELKSKQKNIQAELGSDDKCLKSQKSKLDEWKKQIDEKISKLQNEQQSPGSLLNRIGEIRSNQVPLQASDVNELLSNIEKKLQEEIKELNKAIEADTPKYTDKFFREQRPKNFMMDIEHELHIDKLMIEKDPNSKEKLVKSVLETDPLTNQEREKEVDLGTIKDSQVAPMHPHDFDGLTRTEMRKKYDNLKTDSESKDLEIEVSNLVSKHQDQKISELTDQAKTKDQEIRILNLKVYIKDQRINELTNQSRLKDEGIKELKVDYDFYKDFYTGYIGRKKGKYE